MSFSSKWQLMLTLNRDQKSQILSKNYIDIISTKLYFFPSTRIMLKKEPERRYFADLFFPCPEFHCVVVTEDKSPQIFFPTTNTQKKSNKNGNRKGKKNWCVWLKTARITKTLQCRLIFITCEILSKQKFERCTQ